MIPVLLPQVLTLPDVLVNNHFSLLLPDIPGGGDTEAFWVRNMTAVLPKKSHGVTKAVLHRHSVHFANRQDFGDSFTATFMEMADRRILRALRGWQNLIVNPQTGIPFPKIAYARIGKIEVYNALNIPIESRTFFGIWPSEVSEIQLDGASENTPITVSVTFTYDAWD
jgi:hypothetical protein